MHRLLRTLLGFVALATTLAPFAPAARAQTTDDRFFPQTSYRVDNDAFWNYFQRRGGVRTFGYPVSRQFRLLGFPVQIFQREVMQQNPDGSVATLNLLDEGLMPYTRINFSTFPASDPAVVAATPSPSDPAYAEKIVQFVAAQAPDTFEGEPVNFNQTFNSTVTYEDAYPNGDGPTSVVPLLNLELWGAPTSKPTRDPSNHDFVYQRFQRGIMHYDKACGCTQGLLLADYLKAVLTGQNLPADLDAQARDSRFYKQYAPGSSGSIARPNQLPGSDLTNGFEQQQPSSGTSSGSSPNTVAPSGGFAFGFQAHMWDANGQAKDMIAGIAKNAGFNWVKQQVEWSAVERAPGQYDFGELDAIVNASNAKGLNVLLSVVHAPAFLRGPTTGLMPADNGTFQALMLTMSSRYQGKVQAYELWNEENLDRETGTGNVNPGTYLALLKAGYAGVKAGDGQARVLLGAPSPTGANVPGVSMDDLEYLRELYAVNGGEVKQYFDALGAHPSGFSIPPDCTPDTPQCSLSGGYNNHPSFFAFYRVGQYHDVMVQNGDGDRKIWFTEFGYDSTDAPPPGYEYGKYISEQQQGEFLVRAFQKSRELGYVGGMIVWNLNFQPFVPMSSEKWGFGVLRPDWSPRPAYTMLAQMPKQ